MRLSEPFGKIKLKSEEPFMGTPKIFATVAAIVLGSFSNAAYSEIREVQTMVAALAEVDADTLLLFDLDNTIMRTPQYLGSDHFFDELVSKALTAGGAMEQAVKDARNIWVAIQRKTATIAVEDTTPNLIKQLQDRGFLPLGFTARPLDIEEATRKQLLAIGVDFATRPFRQSEPLIVTSGDDNGRYSGGILYGGFKNSKGPLLVDFLKQLDLHPRKVVFVDDKLKNVKSVDEALTTRGFNVICYRYGAADAWVKSYQPKVVEYELNHFNRTGEIISDIDATRLIGTR